MASQTVPNRLGTCQQCGRPYEPYPRRQSAQRFCCASCREKAWHARQGSLFAAPAPLPPVRDQRVPKPDRPKLCRMSRLIYERVQQGPARASELHAMFPGARSVRTRISDVGRFVGPAWRSAPVKGVVGEWIYWIAEAL